MDLCSEETTKNVESRSKEFSTRVLLVTQTAEMVDNMEREVASGVASLDDAKLTTSGKDIGSVESSVTPSIITSPCVKKLEMDFLALEKGRRAVQRVLQQRQRGVDVVEGSTFGRPGAWIPNRLELGGRIGMT